MDPVFDLTAWDWIVVNTSAGKDSQAMMSVVCRMARAQGVLARVVAVHCDLGQVEWKGTRELAQEHAAAQGIPLRVIRREKGDLLAQVEARGRWPDSGNRYCTSDQKRDQAAKVHTALAREAGLTMRPARILNCMGFRAEESPARAKRPVLERDERTSSGRKEVWDWLPVHDWTVGQVWDEIRACGMRHHPAYDLGMPRLSCCFCIFAPKAALMIAGQANPELLDEYCRVEEKIGHRFTNKMAIAEVREALRRGESPGKVSTWEM